MIFLKPLAGRIRIVIYGIMKAGESVSAYHNEVKIENEQGTFEKMMSDYRDPLPPRELRSSEACRPEVEETSSHRIPFFMRTLHLMKVVVIHLYHHTLILPNPPVSSV